MSNIWLLLFPGFGILVVVLWLVLALREHKKQYLKGKSDLEKEREKLELWYQAQKKEHQKIRNELKERKDLLVGLREGLHDK